MTTARTLRVALALNDLHGGGAQRVVLTILRGLDRRRFEPRLIVLEDVGAFRDRVPPDVPLLSCGRYAAGGRAAWFGRLVGFLRDESLDLTVSFLWFTNAACLLARGLSGRSLPLVVAERVSLVRAHERLVEDLARAATIRILYRRAEGLLTNAVAMADQLAPAAGVPRERVVTIPNPVDVARLRTLAEGRAASRPAELPVVVGMGRLVPQKGFDIAVRALALARTPFRLRLLGEGPEGPRLAALARELGVGGRLDLPGFVENPFPEIASAALFILPSRFEGFPNALLEAMALGVPCVAARCPTGPEEILKDGENGLLVRTEAPEALATAVDELLRDPVRRTRIGEAGARRADAFDAVHVVRRFEELFVQVAG